MINNDPARPQTKRPLTKVRRGFIKKVPDETALMPMVPLNKHVTLYRVLPVCSAAGLVEIDRKLYLDGQTMNFFYKQSGFCLETNGPRKSITIFVQPIPETCSFPPEYLAQRLESYGDRKLALWAQKLRTYNSVYSQLIAKYLNWSHSKDLETQRHFQDIKAKASRFCADIEANYSYIKTIGLASEDYGGIYAWKYSDDFLEKMGHKSVDSFLEWTKKHGLPKILSNQSPINLLRAQKFLECIFFNINVFNVMPKFKTTMFDKDGLLVEGTFRQLSSFELAEDGFYFINYMIIEEIAPTGSLPGTNSFLVDDEISEFL